MKTKLLLMLVVVGLAAGVAQANMLKNPSFEEGAFGNDLTPDYWTHWYTTYSPMHTWISNAAEAHWGSKYMKMNMWSWGDTAWLLQTVNVTPSQEYAFSVWAKCPDIGETSKAWGYYEYLDSAGAVISEGWLPLGEDVEDVGSNWTHVEFGTATAPESAIRVIYSITTGLENSLMGILYDDAGMSTPLPSSPSPAWESLVPVGDVELSWTNLAPKDVNDLYVDVLFGTDPISDYTKIVTAGEDVNSVTVEDLAIGTYYWQVNSYIYGDPATTSYETNPGDPNIIRGCVWSFDAVTDAPPSSVDAGIDMITWSDESVDLDATVVDDDESALTIAWSSDDPAGTDVLFSATDIEDATVTITKGPYDAAGIVNPSFEYFLIGWTIVGAEGGWAGVWDGTFGPREYVTPTDGDWCAWLNGEHGDPIEGAWLSQTLAETLAAETTYTLTVDVINDGYYNEDVHYKVQLLAGEAVIAEDDDSHPLDPVPPGTSSNWETSTVVCTLGGPSDPNFIYVGEPLEIRLVTKAGTGEMSFDNVHLTADPEFPPPDFSTVELTLRASDDANPMYVLKDTMTVDVYDDACAAAKATGLSAENPGDIDGNCITNLEDLVAAVETWLNDTSLMEAVVKPAGPGIVSLASAGIGEALYERWTGSGSAESMLTESSTPDYTEILTSTEWGVGDDNALSNYRGRITAWLIPPVTGDYIFWIVTDDNSRLWLSSDHDPANATLVASVPGWAAEDVWDKFPEQQSAPITLQGGKAYWLRGGYQEGGGGDHIRIAWASSEAGIAEHTIIEGQYLIGMDPTGLVRPSPGAYVHPSDDLELSWTNMDPNNPGDPVYVDVWFGTEPNEPDPAYDMAKIVDATTPAGEDVNSVTVDASTIGETYYWRVDSYIYGAGHINEPNMFEGFMWRFHAVTDIPVSADAGDDMITWSGEAVALEPTIDDDGVSVLTIAWSSDALAGTDAEFSATDIEDPIVTITKVPYSTARIVNAGFEDPVLADGDWTEGLDGTPGWSQSQDASFDALGTDRTVYFGAGALNPDTATYGYEAPVGANIGYMGSSNNPKYTCLKQSILATLQADTEYVLSALVGNPQAYNVSEFNPDGVAPDYQIALLADGVVVASSSGAAPDDASYWNTASLTFTPDAGHAQLGRQLEIWLIGYPLNDAILDPENGTNSGGYELHFDDVQLTADPPFPPPSVQTVTLTVSVHDEVSSDEDTMTIDVYNNPCQAAIIGLGQEYDPGDFDADCDTDIEDFAEMALTWLVDYTLTEPAEKL